MALSKIFIYCSFIAQVLWEFSLLWSMKTVMDAHSDATEHLIICPPLSPALEECPLPTCFCLCALKNCLPLIWKYLLSSSVFMSFNGTLTYTFHVNYLCFFNFIQKYREEVKDEWNHQEGKEEETLKRIEVSRRLKYIK